VHRADLGIHLFVWGADWYRPEFDLPRVLATCRRLGYAGVEVPWLRPVDDRTLQTAVAALRAEGLWATVSTSLPPAACLVDPARLEAGRQWLLRAVAAAAALGSPVLVGPLLAPVGELPADRARDPAAAAEVLADLAARAEAYGVRLCLEPLNRFETDVVNTLAQGAELCRRVGGGLRLLADTFHQNIEEDDPLAALRAHLGLVGHVHLSENHRGPVGTGHVPWPEVLRQLRAGGYAGKMVVESFAGHIPEIARATCLWRPLAASPEDFAARSLAYLRDLLDP
jgi:D-psicose/D-tagatose/L-ribulose 3-epimerase